MAKSKYTPEAVKTIADAIALCGTDKAGYEAGGISADTFYDWMKRYPEFVETINEAKREYRDTKSEVLVRQANKAFADYLFGRMERVSVTTERGISARTGEPYEKEIIQRVPVGIPRWAIERVLGGPVDILEAIKCLAEAGILPRWVVQVVNEEMASATAGISSVITGTLPERQSTRVRPGLSEETAAAIRSHILGIQPPGPTELPTEMAGGSESGQNRGEVATDRPIVG